MATQEVLFEEHGERGVIILNRPKALNALTLGMIQTIYPKMLSWANQGIKLVVIKGAGEKAFCAGGDVRSLVEAGMAGDRDFAKSFFRDEYRLNHLTSVFPAPYVALIDGITMGGGVGMSVHGPFRVATERTLFAMPETAIGLFPDVGGGHFLPRLPGSLGMFLALTGVRLKGWDLVHANIATHFVASGKMGELEAELLRREDVSAAGVSALLSEFQAQSGERVEFSLASVSSSVDHLFSGESVSEILRALERDGSEWALTQLGTLRKMSPTSMAVTHAQLRRGARMSLAEDLEMENRMGNRVMDVGKDFFEGVRSVLMDKEKGVVPRWDPATLDEVTTADVEAHFAPLADPSKELCLVGKPHL